ncbi:unnamed protein product [Bursaphelenchus okinawaensis]|uniref:Uncharacterized protein n=1 Tax=Bursaphelenchus okinawaensis TaxID=465554 RepID=A0A811L719_9BILA|nr:unnamed protein product [Bursaphelenchus okinawaensis]CAG9119604.1 unnamed protein product [Bursaphelenchus okinawaensis]
MLGRMGPSVLFVLFNITFVLCNHFKPFIDSGTQQFGLINHEEKACLVLKFDLKLYNFNLNGSDIATETLNLLSSKVRLSGYCALHNEVTKSSELVAKWDSGERKKQIRFLFREAFVRVLGQPVDQLRWQLQDVTYTEKFKSRSIEFASSNDTIVVSAPVRQKFVCKDKLNVTLYHEKYRNFIVEFLPEIDMQPVNTASSFGSNIYLCERTRKRTLSESFQNSMTVFSGVVLGLSSVGTLSGYSVWRQLLPSRRTLYNDI